jgi:hypothetical protein
MFTQRDAAIRELLVKPALLAATREWHDGFMLGSYVACRRPTEPDNEWRLELDGLIGVVLERAENGCYTVVFLPDEGRNSVLRVKESWLVPMPLLSTQESLVRTLYDAVRQCSMLRYLSVLQELGDFRGDELFKPGTYVMYNQSVGMATFVCDHNVILVFANPIVHIRAAHPSRLRFAEPIDWMQQHAQTLATFTSLHATIQQAFMDMYFRRFRTVSSDVFEEFSMRSKEN